MGTFEVNCAAPLSVIQELYSQKLIGGSQQSVIINITSTLGSIANSTGRVNAYRVSKAALNMLTKNMSAELASENIIACAVHPGWVRTSMGGEGADISVEESIAGILGILEKDLNELQGQFLSYSGEPLPF